MENKTSFDLNSAIQLWRDDMAKSPALRNENLNELESHLRDSIATLHASRLSDEEAFIIAERRIGTRGTLAGEFGKVNGAAIWFDRALWILLATQLWALIVSISAISFCAGSWFLHVLNFERAVPISDETARTICGVLFSPLVIAVGVGIVWWRYVRPGGRTVSFLKNLLRRPRILALSTFVLCVLFRISSGILFGRMFIPEFYREIRFSFPVGPIFLQLYQFVILALLTFFVARKRVRAIA